MENARVMIGVMVASSMRLSDCGVEAIVANLVYWPRSDGAYVLKNRLTGLDGFVTFEQLENLKKYAIEYSKNSGRSIQDGD